MRWSDHVGRRIVVRVRGATGLFDVLGDLIHADDEQLLVLTRRGEVSVEVAAITAGHPVPPAASRAAPAHRALSVGSLELVMAQHWQAGEQDWLGGWLLRATGGFTNRANSVLAVGEPGMPMDVAVLEVSDWYADRGLRPVAATPEPRLDEEDTEQLLAAAGAFEAARWQQIPDGGAFVLTAATGELRGAAGEWRSAAGARADPASGSLPAGLRLQLDERPDDAWIRAYRYRGRAVPETGRKLLLSAPEQVFISIRDGDGTVAGVSRGSLAEGWGGLTAMEVSPAYRRRGLGQVLIAAVAEWAWQRGARSTYVQVAQGNTIAHQLYLKAGFEDHHRYNYLAPPP